MTKIASVLITRPEQQGRVLANKLASLGITSNCQPFFDIVPTSNNSAFTPLSQQHNVYAAIFVSVAAVESAQQYLPLSRWPVKHMIAVGKASADALKRFGISPIYPELHTSEGVLALPVLTQVANENIIIVRGNGGRELMAAQLKKSGAIVSYIESYRRSWRELPARIAEDWRQANIQCVVITSNALLESVVHLLKLPDNYWQNTCLWVVASERIAQNAQRLGLKNIINAHGASDQAIIDAIVSDGIEK